MFACLYCGWCEVVKRKKKKNVKRKKRKRKKKEKKFEKQKEKRVCNNCANKLCFGVKLVMKKKVGLEFHCLKLCGSNYSLRFRQVFVLISFRNYHLFVNQATLHP